MRTITFGKHYLHFKNKPYLVLDIATHSETGEQMVVYRQLNGEGIVCVRPYALFASEVERQKYPDVKQCYRFEELDEMKEDCL